MAPPEMRTAPGGESGGPVARWLANGSSVDDAHCCGGYDIAELRLGFGCPAHTVGPL